MAKDLPTLDVRTRQEWRRWLAKHHASSPGIWLVRHKQHSGVESMPYEDLVSEALCFGWVDSLVKRLDDDRYLQKFTPRKATSAWSDSNRTRWAELKADGLLAPAGLAAPPTDKRYAPKPHIPEMPGYFESALERDRSRYASTNEIRKWMSAVGFTDCATHEVQHIGACIDARVAIEQAESDDYSISA